VITERLADPRSRLCEASATQPDAQGRSRASDHLDRGHEPRGGMPLRSSLEQATHRIVVVRPAIRLLT